MLRLERILSYFLIPAFFFLFHMFLDLAFNVYDRFPWFASVMHFAGGTMLAITFFLLMNYLNKEKYFKSDKFMRFVFVISLVSLISIFWEFYEYFMVTVFKTGWNMTYNDTIWDFFVDLTGGLFGSSFFALKKD